MSLRIHEIAEQNHHILNPLTHEKLMLIGEICQLDRSSTVLDLCCGKGEMLCQWSQEWGISGIGVDISSVFLASAKARADELDVQDNVTFIEEDAAKYSPAANTYDVVSCLGATWIGDGLVGTIQLLEKALKPDGIMIVGEPFWNKLPSDEQCKLMEATPDEYATLVGTLDRIESAGFELVEMVAANLDSWDRYAAKKWITIDTWLRENPEDEDAEKLKTLNAKWKRQYLELEREFYGWAVFVMRRK